MDYKSTFSTPPAWVDEHLENARETDYFELVAGFICELDDPARSTTFLMIEGFYDESTHSAVRYAIEAPASCLMRQAFERGALSWMDFWHHRGWLVRIDHDMTTRICKTTYIHPSQLDYLTMRAFQRYGEASPFELIRRNLESLCRSALSFGEDPSDYESQYREFMALHGAKFLREAA